MRPAPWLSILTLASFASACDGGPAAQPVSCAAAERQCGGARGCYALCLCGGDGEAACQDRCGVAPEDAIARDVSGWPPSSDEDDLLALINAQRAEGGCCRVGSCFGAAPPLQADASLTAAARRHAADMADRRYFSHETPDGLSFEDRVRAAGYRGCVLGENLGAGYPTAAEVLDAWMASPEHCENALWSAFTSVGVARSTDASAGGAGVLWVADFGG